MENETWGKEKEKEKGERYVALDTLVGGEHIHFINTYQIPTAFQALCWMLGYSNAKDRPDPYCLARSLPTMALADTEVDHSIILMRPRLWV